MRSTTHTGVFWFNVVADQTFTNSVLEIRHTVDWTKTILYMAGQQVKGPSTWPEGGMGTVESRPSSVG